MAKDQYTRANPVDRYPQPDFGEQKIEYPGLDSEVDPKPDYMWIDDRGTLWLPAAQLNRMAPFQGGTSKVTRPIQVFTISIGEGPAQNDHR